MTIIHTMNYKVMALRPLTLVLQLMDALSRTEIADSYAHSLKLPPGDEIRVVLYDRVSDGRAHFFLVKELTT